MTPEAALAKAKKMVGVSEMAKRLKVTPSAVSQWDRVPSGRVLDVERLSGVPRHKLRPDLYPAGEGA